MHWGTKKIHVTHIIVTLTLLKRSRPKPAISLGYSWASFVTSTTYSSTQSYQNADYMPGTVLCALGLQKLRS